MELNNDQAEKIGMFNRRKEFTDIPEINTLFISDALVKGKLLEIVDVRKLLDKAVAQKLADTTGDSPQKKLMKDLVIKTIGVKARACSVYFEDKVMKDVAAVLSKKKSYYDKQKDEDIGAVISGVRKILFDNMGALGGYGVNAAFFTLLDGQVLDMLKWIAKPSTNRENQYAGDADINKYIGVMDEKYDQLDRLVINAFEATNADEVSAFLETGNQSTVGVRHNVVEVSMKLLPSLTGINRGKIEIADTVTGEVLKTIYTDAFGLATFNCVNKDLYATASADGCVTQKRLFKPVYRGTFNLDFEMSAV